MPPPPPPKRNPALFTVTMLFGAVSKQEVYALLLLECTKVQNPQRHAWANPSARALEMCMCGFQKWPTACVGYNAGSSVSLQRSNFKEIHTNNLTFVARKYVISFSGQTDAPEVRSRITDTHTQNVTVAAHAH